MDRRSYARKRAAHQGITNARLSDRAAERIQRHVFKEEMPSRGMDALRDDSSSPPVIVFILLGLGAAILVSTLLGKPPVDPIGAYQYQQGRSSDYPNPKETSQPSPSGWGQ